MSQVPPDLYPNILSRVFAESLLRFRCVCKAWCRIIDNPTFIKLHLHRQSDRGQLILSDDAGSMIYSLSLDSLNRYSTGTVVVASPLKTSIRCDVPRVYTVPVTSCKGLILIYRYPDQFALWNPFTREAHFLPSYTPTVLSNQRVCSSNSSLGYDSVTDDYKVVIIVKCYNQTWGETLVYSLKSNSWRRVKGCPYIPLYWGPGVFANGVVHWFTGRYVKDRLIVAFDLATEDYYTLPLPSILSKPRRHSPNPLLDALGECLVLTWYDSVYRLEDYGGEKLWTKLFSISGIGLREVRPITYLNTKREVLLWVRAADTTFEYFWFDIETKIAKKFRIAGAQDKPYSRVCLPSLVRLCDIGSVDESIAGKGTSGRKRKGY
ncbi:hypothetical protein ACJIZ3_020627 [Penstemon smallii]|uniref:F-box domain-containing protein n=1 Tax=Penstemon smallii TaxID=265156 RepID=A0ABD3SJS4_9LAMI